MPEHSFCLSTRALSFGISSTEPRTDGIVDATAPKSEINDLKKRGESSQGLSPFLLDLLLDPYSVTGSPSASIDSLYLRTLKPIAILLLKHPLLRFLIHMHIKTDQARVNVV